MINLKKLISRRKKETLSEIECSWAAWTKTTLHTLSAVDAKQKTQAVLASQREEFREIISNINKDIQSKIDEGLCEVDYDPDSIPDTVRAYYKDQGYYVKHSTDLNYLAICWGADVIIG